MSIFQKNDTCHEDSEGKFKERIFLNDLLFCFEEKLKLDKINEIDRYLSGKEKIYKTWKQFGAEALLIRKECGYEVDDEIYDFFKEISPFDNHIKLKDCWGKQSAMAHFPLNNLTGKAELGHIWAIEGIDSQTVMMSNKTWDGDSYKLAEALAKKALKENAGIKKRLASNWIITGNIDDSGRVKKVELGNKLSISTKRKWLVPTDSMNQISPEIALNKTIRSADEITTAWNHITGKGTKTTGENDWPTQIEELHILVGGNIKAQVASILLTKPDKIVLWHSESDKFSKIPAEQIKKVVADISLDIESKFLSSKKMSEAEKTLQDYFKEKNSSLKILFNVTSGNRLMSYAVQSIARLHPNIDLIYRDADEENPNRFNILNYREFPPYLGTIKGNLPDEINSKFLYGRDEYTKAADFIKKLKTK